MNEQADKELKMGIKKFLESIGILEPEKKPSDVKPQTAFIKQPERPTSIKPINLWEPVGKPVDHSNHVITTLSGEYAVVDPVPTTGQFVDRGHYNYKHICGINHLDIKSRLKLFSEVLRIYAEAKNQTKTATILFKAIIEQINIISKAVDQNTGLSIKQLTAIMDEINAFYKIGPLVIPPLNKTLWKIWDGDFDNLDNQDLEFLVSEFSMKDWGPYFCQSDSQEPIPTCRWAVMAWYDYYRMLLSGRGAMSKAKKDAFRKLADVGHNIYKIVEYYRYMDIKRISKIYDKVRKLEGDHKARCMYHLCRANFKIDDRIVEYIDNDVVTKLNNPKNVPGFYCCEEHARADLMIGVKEVKELVDDSMLFWNGHGYVIVSDHDPASKQMSKWYKVHKEVPFHMDALLSSVSDFSDSPFIMQLLNDNQMPVGKIFGMANIGIKPFLSFTYVFESLRTAAERAIEQLQGTSGPMNEEITMKT